MAQEHLDQEAFEQIYGPLRPMTPAEAADLMAGLAVPWWIAGGWAIEAFTGVARHHEDIDLSVLRRDEAVVRAHLAPHFHLWSASPSGLKHLADAATPMPPDSGQIWLREHAMAPWRGEVLFNADRDGLWLSKRDADFARPLDDVTWERQGVRYLNPELVLIHKVASGRPKDHADFDAALPVMSPAQRATLLDFVVRHAPDHPWRARLQG